jgi:hypothetical protein
VKATAEPTLSPREQLLVDRIAERVATLLHAEPARVSLVDAATLAHALGVSRDCVYAHAAELGGQRIGDGPRGRLRFDLDTALSAWTSRSTSRESQPSQTPVDTGTSARHKRDRLGTSRELLPIRGSTGVDRVGEGRS